MRTKALLAGVLALAVVGVLAAPWARAFFAGSVAGPSAPPVTSAGSSFAASPAPTAPPNGSPIAGSGSQPPVPTSGLFISVAEVAALPHDGAAYEAVVDAAKLPWPSPDLANPNGRHQLHVLAAALLGHREDARDGIQNAINLFKAKNGTVLAMGRQLPAYIIAADLIDLRALDPKLDETFRADLAKWRDGKVGTHKRWSVLSFTFGDSSNNWGAHAGAAVIAIDRYLGRPLDPDWAIFRGFTGDVKAHEFYTPPIAHRTWLKAKVWTPVQVVPGDPRDGAVTEDAWRDGKYPRISDTYVMDSAQALAVQAEILTRAGYPAWPLLARSAAFLDREGTPWSEKGGRGGHTLAYLYNKRLGLGAPTTNVGDRMAWSFGFGDWLYQ